MKKIGYLGPEGSYSFVAAKIYNSRNDLVGKISFYDIIEGVEKGFLDYGILPIENSTEGAVTLVMDALLKTKKSRIIGEVTITVKHLLLGVGEHIDQVKYIVSHSQALQQCRQFLNANYPHIQLISCESSSQACLMAKEKGVEYGAIANEYAGELNKLNIILSDLQDNEFNQTRFIIIGEEDRQLTGKDKTSIAFSLKDNYPGSLFEVLKIFADNLIDLTRIESRPAKSQLGKYVFYIDFSGHITDKGIIDALERMKKFTSYIKVFGSYPLGEVK